MTLGKQLFERNTCPSPIKDKVTSQLMFLLIVVTRLIKSVGSVTCHSTYSCCKVVSCTKTTSVQPSTVTSSGANRQTSKAAVLLPPLTSSMLHKSLKEWSVPCSVYYKEGLGLCQETGIFHTLVLHLSSFSNSSFCSFLLLIFTVPRGAPSRESFLRILSSFCLANG